MPGSGRGGRSQTGLIAAGVIATLVAAAFIVWGLRESAKYEWQAHYQAREYTAYTDQQIRQSCLRPSGIEQQECAAKARHEQRAYQRNEYDLVAQRQSALWAYVMAAAAVIGMGLSAVGVILVWTTFREAKRTADEAWHANEIARDTAKRQLRAYVGIKNIEARYDTKTLDHFISISIQNFGQTPAYDCRVTVSCIKTADNPSKVPLFSKDHPKASRLTMGGGAVNYIIMPFNWSGRLEFDWFVVFGLIRYKDAFGRRRRSLFRYFISKADVEGVAGKTETAGFKACSKGNQAN